MPFSPLLERGAFSVTSPPKRDAGRGAALLCAAATLMLAAVALSLSTQRAGAAQSNRQGKASEDSEMRSITTTTRRRSNAKPPSKVSVYLASPLGFAESTKAFKDRELKPALEQGGIEVEDPWDPRPFETLNEKEIQELDKEIASEKKIRDLDTRRAAWAEVVRKLGARNEALINRAQGVVAVLDGVDVDSGTAAEIGYAAAKGKWVIGYRGDFRRTGEDEAAEVNLQVEYFIVKHGGCVVHSIDELKREVTRRIQGRKE